MRDARRRLSQDTSGTFLVPILASDGQHGRAVAMPWMPWNATFVCTRQSWSVSCAARRHSQRHLRHGERPSGGRRAGICCATASRWTLGGDTKATRGAAEAGGRCWLTHGHAGEAQTGAHRALPVLTGARRCSLEASCPTRPSWTASRCMCRGGASRGHAFIAMARARRRRQRTATEAVQGVKGRGEATRNGGWRTGMEHGARDGGRGRSLGNADRAPALPGRSAGGSLHSGRRRVACGCGHLTRRRHGPSC